jgi:hypothetical protein
MQEDNDFAENENSWETDKREIFKKSYFDSDNSVTVHYQEKEVFL